MCRGRGPAPRGVAGSIASGAPDAAGTVAAAVGVTLVPPAKCTVVGVRYWESIPTLARKRAELNSLVKGRVWDLNENLKALIMLCPEEYTNHLYGTSWRVDFQERPFRDV